MRAGSSDLAAKRRDEQQRFRERNNWRRRIRSAIGD